MTLNETYRDDGAGPKLVYVSTTRLHYDSNGRIRSYSPLMSKEEWSPFFDVFDEITILARVERNHIADEGYILDTTRMDISPLPFYDGLFDYFRRSRAIKAFLSRQISDPHAVYSVRVPCILALFAAERVKRLGAPLIARVRGDVGGVARAILPFPLNELVARRSIRAAQRTVQLADGVIYVTLRAMQKVYPARSGALTLARTSMHFSRELLAIEKKDSVRAWKSGPFSVIAVGSQQQNYKGHDLLIDAVAQIQQDGYSISLTLVGSGRLHEQLQDQALQSGVRDVTFIEHLGTTIDVARHVKEHDLFAMPSRTESLPKALLEAMAVGVLSIGAEVGGIPEVLNSEATFAPDSVPALREKIRHMMNNDNDAKVQRELQSEMVDMMKDEHSGSAVLVRFLERFMNRNVRSRNV